MCVVGGGGGAVGGLLGRGRLGGGGIVTDRLISKYFRLHLVH